MRHSFFLRHSAGSQSDDEMVTVVLIQSTIVKDVIMWLAFATQKRTHNQKANIMRRTKIA